MTKNIYVLYGGVSVEHEISLQSACNVINNLDRNKYNVFPVFITKKGSWISLGKMEAEVKDPLELNQSTDENIPTSLGKFLINDYHSTEENIFFPIIHGTYGEDGSIQGFLEILDVPYVGTQVLGSACTMDKAIANQLMAAANIPQARYLILNRKQYDRCPDIYLEKIKTDLGLPVYIKPANAGSSVGVSQVETPEQIVPAIMEAFRYDRKILVEESVDGNELEITVIGDEDCQASLPGGHKMQQKFFDYNIKYISRSFEHLIPYPLSEQEYKEVRDLAIRAHRAVGCNGLSRVDIFLRSQDRAFLVNEINSMPGMTATSLAPIMWMHTNHGTFSMFLDELITLAEENYQNKKSVARIRG